MDITIFSGDRVKDKDTGFTGTVVGSDETGGKLNRVLIRSEGLVPEGMKAPEQWAAADRVEKLPPRLSTAAVDDKTPARNAADDDDKDPRKPPTAAERKADAAAARKG
jgi:hypothetical protein